LTTAAVAAAVRAASAATAAADRVSCSTVWVSRRAASSCDSTGRESATGAGWAGLPSVMRAPGVVAGGRTPTYAEYVSLRTVSLSRRRAAVENMALSCTLPTRSESVYRKAPSPSSDSDDTAKSTTSCSSDDSAPRGVGIGALPSRISGGMLLSRTDRGDSTSGDRSATAVRCGDRNDGMLRSPDDCTNRLTADLYTAPLDSYTHPGFHQRAAIFHPPSSRTR
jgi:hypothetical protein